MPHWDIFTPAVEVLAPWLRIGRAAVIATLALMWLTSMLVPVTAADNNDQ